ncbi:TetR/AcrR family transcriptional regulator [Salinibaculum rarum]|uniref:TetR/AcrR family transcriptional regulator n=1 Tax=Salinibaculum rarum TaxID=3058903 RepID=UPI00265F21CE|nr:TetR/AcrR family transcriptional regulator [Salinibaculum sp. KK48]
MGTRKAEKTRKAIMEATYQALCKHGYPETTIAKISTEFKKSQSLLYYHYDDKEDLLEDFLQFLLHQLEDEINSIETNEPDKRLKTILDHLLPKEITDEQFQFRRALAEMRSQAPYHEVYHEQFKRTDEFILNEIVVTIENGINAKKLRTVNSKQTAEFLYSAILGAMERGCSLEDEHILELNREYIDEYIEAKLIRYGGHPPNS